MAPVTDHTNTKYIQKIVTAGTNTVPKQRLAVPQGGGKTQLVIDS
jgi:hypothetical protein